MMTTTMPAAQKRWFYSVPVAGWIARDLAREPDSFWYLLVAVLTLLILAVSTWGVAVLAMTALAMVPVMFVILILITLG